ncbi:DUF6397 family protein [Streptomyces xiamenensis]|uniref:DUF6397 family protein n=1 Tax=Streptomyces xiamenensis TaxID=408015 RepID=UPI0036EC0765
MTDHPHGAPGPGADALRPAACFRVVRRAADACGATADRPPPLPAAAWPGGGLPPAADPDPDPAQAPPAPPLLVAEDDTGPRAGDVPVGLWSRAIRTTVRELGLTRHEFEAALDLDELPTVDCAGAPWRRRVPCAALDRLRGDRRTRTGLRDRIRLVNASGGADLLGISTARFARLARGGCFSPVGFHLNRYHALVWRYAAGELRELAGHSPELLRGAVPEGLRKALAAGQDWRPRKWRGRRTALLMRQAAGPWEKAAVPAAVLEPPVLREMVPDPDERAHLALLRPPLLSLPPGGTRTEVIRDVLRATDPEEVRWYRSLLERHLAGARAARPAPGTVPAPCDA